MALDKKNFDNTNVFKYFICCWYKFVKSNIVSDYLLSLASFFVFISLIPFIFITAIIDRLFSIRMNNKNIFYNTENKSDLKSSIYNSSFVVFYLIFKKQLKNEDILSIKTKDRFFNPISIINGFKSRILQDKSVNFDFWVLYYSTILIFLIIIIFNNSWILKLFFLFMIYVILPRD